MIDLTAEIITSGTEILLGELVDTNTAYIARKLRDLGVNVYFHTTVGDNVARLRAAIEIALSRANLVIITGGLGPTVDDVTREAVAAAVGQPLVFWPELMEQIAARFRRLGRPMPENNRRQAFIPAGATPIPNPVGTAPAFRVAKDGAIIIALPGVPSEMEYLMENAVLPYLRSLGGGGVIVSRVLHTAGIGESQIDALLGELLSGSNPTVSLAAHPGQTDVRITAKAATREEALALIDPVEHEIRRRLAGHVYGADGQRLGAVVSALCRKLGCRLAIVESYTAGLLAQELSESGRELIVHHEIVSVEKTGEPDNTAVQRAQRLQAERGAGAALVSLSPDCSQAAPEELITATIVASLGRKELVDSLRFNGHPALFQQWLLNHSLFLLWRLLADVAPEA